MEIIKLEPNKPNQEMIDHLETVLESVKAGKVSSLMIVSTNSEGTSEYYYILNRGIERAIGCLVKFQHILLRGITEDD